jgi:hypothetical protein
MILTGLVTFQQGCKKEMSVSHSECKDFTGKSSSPVNGFGSDTTCLVYNFIPAESKLVLKHINAGFNCCPGNLYCDADVQDSVIILTESEQEALCDCLCLYDLDIIVPGVLKRKYLVVMEEPYANGQESIQFQIDLVQSLNGSFCVGRNQYPWGL